MELFIATKKSFKSYFQSNTSFDHLINELPSEFEKKFKVRLSDKDNYLMLTDSVARSASLILLNRFESKEVLREFTFCKPDGLNIEIQDNVLYSKKNLGPFLTLMHEEDDYLKILDSLRSSKKLIRVLNLLNELIYLENNNLKSHLRTHSTHIFNLTYESLSSNGRNKLRYFYEQGFYHLMSNLVGINDFNDSRIEVIGSFTNENLLKLKGTGELWYEIDFTNGAIVKSNIISIIGVNGVGKTQVLKHYKENCLRNMSFKKIIDFAIVKKRFKSDVVESFPINNIINLDAYSELMNLMRKKKYSHDYFDPIQILESVLISLKIDSFCLVHDNGEVEFYLKVIDAEFNSRKKTLHFFRDGKEIILSQGQKYILNLILVLLNSIQYNSICIFDEPEVYLHPQLVVELRMVLEKVLTSTNSKALIATHSIFLVRELPRENVNILQFNLTGSIWRKPIRETFGASLDSLAYEVFQDQDYSKGIDSFVKDYKKKKKKHEDLVKLPLDIALKVISND